LQSRPGGKKTWALDAEDLRPDGERARAVKERRSVRGQNEGTSDNRPSRGGERGSFKQRGGVTARRLSEESGLSAHPTRGASAFWKGKSSKTEGKKEKVYDGSKKKGSRAKKGRRYLTEAEKKKVWGRERKREGKVFRKKKKKEGRDHAVERERKPFASASVGKRTE